MSKPPLISRKLATRGVICLFLLAAMIGGYNWIRSLRDPDDISSIDSKGMILAVRAREGGSQVVILKPDGKLWASPDFVAGKSDRDAVWRPDGNTVLFSSDREKNVFNIYRWNLMRNLVQRRSLGTRAQFGTSFGPASLGITNDAALVTVAGTVQEFRAQDGSTIQVLPPVGKGASSAETGDEGAGVGSQFDNAYQCIGNSFRVARWGKDKKWVVAVMRGDEAEVLILQSMTEVRPPIKVTAGARVDFDINPKTGEVYLTVLDYKVTNLEEVPKGKLKEVMKGLHTHRIGSVDPDRAAAGDAGGLAMIAISESDKQAFGSPAVAPDGSSILVVSGSQKGGLLQPDRLLRLVVTPSGPKGGRVADGAIYDPSWSPDGSRIVYVKRLPGERAIFVNSSSGGEEKNLSSGQGNFSRPTFSPQ